MHTRNGARTWSAELRLRHRFSLLTVLSTVVLIAWGGFVTSIDAGLAVPDWPSSFNSYDPFNPWPQWWTITPVLAEHGHRLTGALVGIFMLVLAAWTWLKEERRWVKMLSLAALALVIVQGTLGGLRVVLVSLDLAVVHACLAQIFFSLLVALALFTSRSWIEQRDVPAPSPDRRKLRRLAALAAAAVYVQIILGALLRHPGTGIDAALAGIHILGAFIVVGLIVHAAVFIHTRFSGNRLLLKASRIQAGLLLAQFLLGFTAYFVLLDERGMIRPSNLQVVVNTTHLVVGALLFASTVTLAILAFRRPVAVIGEAHPAEPSVTATTLHPATR